MKCRQSVFVADGHQTMQQSDAASDQQRRVWACGRRRTLHDNPLDSGPDYSVVTCLGNEDLCGVSWARSVTVSRARFIGFLPHDATQSAVVPQYVVCPSVRPSVRDVQIL